MVVMVAGCMFKLPEQYLFKQDISIQKGKATTEGHLNFIKYLAHNGIQKIINYEFKGMP